MQGHLYTRNDSGENNFYRENLNTHKRCECRVWNKVINESTWGFPGVTVTHSLQPWSFSSPMNGRIFTATFTLEYSDEASSINIICMYGHLHIYAVWILCNWIWKRWMKWGCYTIKRKWEKCESKRTRGGDLKKETKCVKQTQPNRYICTFLASW